MNTNKKDFTHSHKFCDMWKKKINLIHVKYNFAIDNHFPLINSK